MSPEERATLTAAYLRDDLASVNGDCRFEEVITDAIRAAENDVLAEAIRLCSMHTGHPLYCQGYLDAIDVLRSLKSKPPEGK